MKALYDRPFRIVGGRPLSLIVTRMFLPDYPLNYPRFELESPLPPEALLPREGSGVRIPHAAPNRKAQYHRKELSYRWPRRIQQQRARRASIPDPDRGSTGSD
jgi:hypothetical protein